ncbi:MAG: GNAT family N-acetyltransferase [Verrucomicrobiae bacterium]|nr:GNAT family N-acetyltransferase [Verrucomicrobiae bacterium]
MIREATEKDRPVWMELRRLVYTDCTDAFHHEDINIWLRDPDKECFMAEMDGAVAGFLEASLRNVVDGCLSSPVGYVEGICVFPQFRGRGISRALISAAEQWMKKKGCTEMGSDAELQNEEAIRYHRALGFEESYRVVQFRKNLK